MNEIGNNFYFILKGKALVLIPKAIDVEKDKDNLKSTIIDSYSDFFDDTIIDKVPEIA
jgi:hypothetical protein